VLWFTNRVTESTYGKSKKLPDVLCKGLGGICEFASVGTTTAVVSCRFHLENSNVTSCSRRRSRQSGDGIARHV
jgi:hypothetical protein